MQQKLSNIPANNLDVIREQIARFILDDILAANEKFRAQ